MSGIETSPCPSAGEIYEQAIAGDPCAQPQAALSALPVCCVEVISRHCGKAENLGTIITARETNEVPLHAPYNGAAGLLPVAADLTA
jgi:hypothetical protein